MSYFNYENMHLRDQQSIKRVIKGLKPGAHLRKPITKIKNVTVFKQRFISQKKTVEEFFDKEFLKEHFSSLGELIIKNTIELFEKVRHQIVAEALARLQELPRDYQVREYTLERPEAAILKGLLYGFKTSHIKTYVKGIIKPQWHYRC